MKIELQQISKHFSISDTGPRRTVLDQINLTIKPGDSIGILGPSGSGKSTLLNIVGTLDDPTDGKVFLDGREVGGMQEKELARLRNREIGFVFQLHHLLPQLTMLENVLVPTIPIRNKSYKKEAQKRAVELLDKVGLAERLDQRPGQLSVGECQRAAVVRALINQPKLLLADEPTGSLDRPSAERMGDLLSELNREQGLTLIVVTHAEYLAEKMQSVYHLRDGKLNTDIKE